MKKLTGLGENARGKNEAPTHHPTFLAISHLYRKGNNSVQIFQFTIKKQINKSVAR